MEVGFHYGALCEPLEVQANKQGFTLGDKKETIEELNHAMLMCWIHGLATDSQKDAMMKKMQKKVVKALKPLKSEQEDLR